MNRDEEAGVGTALAAAASLEREVELRDATRVRLRPIRPDDAPRLVALYDCLSQDSRYHRFFSVMRRLPRARSRAP